MRITLLQTAPEWENPEKSLDDARRMLMGSKPTDLIVLPEMFSTGFAPSPSEVAEPEDGQSLTWMKELATRRGCAVAGSVPVHVEGTYRNRFYFVYPDGNVRFYDKHHLFTF